MKRHALACFIGTPVVVLIAVVSPQQNLLAATADCAENGGTMQCIRATPEPWTYAGCLEHVTTPNKTRAMCYAWFEGTGSPNVCQGKTTPTTESDAVRRAANTERYYHAKCASPPAFSALDHWLAPGETISSPICWNGGPNFDPVTGIETRNFAKVDVTMFEPSECTTQSITRGHFVLQRFRDGGSLTCPNGYTLTPDGHNCSRSLDNTCPIGNPVFPGSGCKVQRQADYESSGTASALTFTRYYDSRGYAFQPISNPSVETTPSGQDYWRSNYDHRLYATPNSSFTIAAIQRPSGLMQYFDINGRQVHNLGRERGRLRVRLDGAGWDYVRADGSVERYDNAGRLTSVVDGSGQEQTLTYSDLTTPPSIAPSSGLLTAVTDDFGHILQFTYDTTGSLRTLSDPAGNIYRYQHDSNQNLTAVIYPDATPGDDTDNPRRIYHYEDTNHPYALTGITDENGDRFATYGYDATGSTVSTEHATTTNEVPQKRFSFRYDSATQTTVTDAIGTVQVFTFQETLGVKNLISRINQNDGKGITQMFDANNNLTTKTNQEGRTTSYTYNTGNQRISITEASGTPDARTTTYEYFSPDLDLVTRVLTPSVANGQQWEIVTVYEPTTLTVLSIIHNGFWPDGTSVSHATGFQYNALGQVTQIDGPRIDTSDVTKLAYYECNTGAECGQLQSVTNALNQVITYDRYDDHGRLLQRTDPNGVVTTYTYSKRGRMLSITQTPRAGNPRTTSYTYDGVNQVQTVTTPDGVVLTYAHDAAHDLRSITDNLGNKIEYLYDLKGNRIRNDTKDPDGTLVRTIHTAYDIRDRVVQINAAGSITQLVNDAVGNLTAETDPNQNPGTAHSYDPLDRLHRTLDALGNPTGYSYDINDQLTQTTAPNDAVTTYEYDDLGNQLQEVSPDRGTVAYSHDAAGNVTSMTDARGVTVVYTYDSLNRIATIDYPDAAEDITYTYDTCINGIGRLCTLNDESGTTKYAYDAFGNVSQHDKIELGVTYTTHYTYDAGDRILSMTYPDGRDVTYIRDAIGRVMSVDTIVDSSPITIVSNRTYRPDGLLTRQDLGNGLIETCTYDLQGRLLTQNLGSVNSRAYGYDANGNVVARDIGVDLTEYTYDALDRLTDDASSAGNVVFTYDGNGNRLTASNTEYTYTVNSNRLEQIGNKAITTDAAGNIVHNANGDWSYLYNQASRLTEVKKRSKRRGAYVYNALGQRTRKDGASIYHYDLSGNLIAETDTEGSLIITYVWADGVPIAQIDVPSSSGGDGKGHGKGKGNNGGTDSSETLVFLMTDYLGTPRIATDGAGNIVWKWDGDAFGSSQPTGTATINLRFPGQYYDQETGFHYNWHRYYDPSTGRYITSDPIGLEAGINTYAYSLSNPLRYFDTDGLEVRYICRRVEGFGAFPRPKHCFVYVQCSEEDWSRVLSLFGDPGSGIIPGYPNFGYKHSYDPSQPYSSPDDGRDDPFAPSAFNGSVADLQCRGGTCDFEKEVLRRYAAFPNGKVHYDPVFGPNSNTFASGLLNGRVPAGSPGGNPLTGAPGVNYKPFSGPPFGGALF